MTLSVSATKIVKGQLNSPILNEVLSMPVDNSNATKLGKIGFGINMRVPEMFGPYSSCEVSITLQGEGDLDNFEEVLNTRLDRANVWVRGTLNQIAAASGSKPVFG
jgi:hypothetical protein